LDSSILQLRGSRLAGGAWALGAGVPTWLKSAGNLLKNGWTGETRRQLVSRKSNDDKQGCRQPPYQKEAA